MELEAFSTTAFFFFLDGCLKVEWLAFQYGSKRMDVF